MITQVPSQQVNAVHKDSPHTELKAVLNADDEVLVSTDWPSYASLVRGHSGEVNLTAQPHEVKAVVRKAIPSIITNICFFDFYPKSTVRAVWHKKALLQAAKELKAKNAPAAHRYDKIRQRLKVDEDYSPILGKIVGTQLLNRTWLISSSSMGVSLFFGTISNHLPSKLLFPNSSFMLAVLTKWAGI